MAKRNMFTVDASHFGMDLADLIAALERLHNEDPNMSIDFVTEDEGFYTRHEVAKVEFRTTLSYHEVLEIIS